MCFPLPLNDPPTSCPVTPPSGQPLMSIGMEAGLTGKGFSTDVREWSCLRSLRDPTLRVGLPTM